MLRTPTIDLCFLWHMHQPLYKDLASGEYKLPWTRLHALKDYFGMVKLLEEFPEIHQTFNLVPSLLVQIEEYASGEASDPFLRIALKPSEELDSDEKEFILKYFFQANEQRVIRRYPRYAELFEILRRNEHNVKRAIGEFDTQMIRDLQVLSQLAWFDEYFLQHDTAVRALVDKGRNFTRADQELIGRKESEALARVIPVYRDFAKRGQIELSTSAFYHPIIPLLCDSNIAAVSHPYIQLPQRFAYPEDAKRQLDQAITFMTERFGVRPAGMWPSEGSVSDATLALAASCGFKWTASDDGVLARSLGLDAAGRNTYQAYRFSGEPIQIVFRDRHLSDLIAFVYPKLKPAQAASHFLESVYECCEPILANGQNAVVPIILDGENAWEAYAQNGRPFLRELYSRISADPGIRARTMSEALADSAGQELEHVHPGSWIDANFDIWIGAEEDNLAWEYLREAREMYDSVRRGDRASDADFAAKNLALEELLIAEGSDWAWWYGPEHETANKVEFDQLFRGHLTNAYRLLGQDVPAVLNQPITRPSNAVRHESPKGLIQPTIDGTVSRASEWADAGRYRVDARSGNMHSQRLPVTDLYYGTDGRDLFLRLDMADPSAPRAGLTFQVHLKNPAGEQFEIAVKQASPSGVDAETNIPDTTPTVAFEDILEVKVSFSALRVRFGEPVRLQMHVLRNGLPVASIPTNGDLELHPGMMAAYAY